MIEYIKGIKKPYEVALKALETANLENGSYAVSLKPELDSALRPFDISHRGTLQGAIKNAEEGFREINTEKKIGARTTGNNEPDKIILNGYLNTKYFVSIKLGEADIHVPRTMFEEYMWSEDR